MTLYRTSLTLATGVLLCLLGLLVLSGWALGNQSLVRIVPGSVAMSINTALMFLVAGACLLMGWRGWQHGRLFGGATWFILGLAGTIMVEHVFDVDLPVDLASVHDALGDGHAEPGRTAPNACAAFLAAGAALQLAAARAMPRWKARVIVALAGLVFLIGLTAFLGYILRLDAMYPIATLNRMAAFTALGIATLGVGLWSLVPAATANAPQQAHNAAQRITTLAAALLMVFATAIG